MEDSGKPEHNAEITQERLYVNDQEHVCGLNYLANRKQKTKIMLKQLTKDIQIYNIGFAFIFFDTNEEIKEFYRYFRKFKKDIREKTRNE